MVSGQVFIALVCSVFASSPAEALSQLRDQPSKFVESSKDALVIELGRSRLLRFPEGIRRTALSNANVSDVVQVGLKDLFVLGRKPGAATLTVWPADRQAAPSVIVIRVERKLRRDD